MAARQRFWPLSAVVGWTVLLVAAIGWLLLWLYIALVFLDWWGWTYMAVCVSVGVAPLVLFVTVRLALREWLLTRRDARGASTR